MKNGGFFHQRYARVCTWCVTGALVVTGLAVLIGQQQAEPAAYHQSRDLTVVRELADSETRVYILREFDGVVALFAPGREEPFELTDILVSSLPYADQVSLRQGLVLRGEEALRQTLEDFGS